MAVVETKVGRVGLFLANPMVAKLNKVEETGDNEATAKGIALKTVFLILLTIGGIALFFLTANLFPSNYMMNIGGYDINYLQAIICFGALLVGCIGTFIVFKFVKSAWFFGSIYSLAQGYALAFAFHIFGDIYVYAGLLALAITIILVLVMLFLYHHKIINFNKKAVSAIITLFVVDLVLGLICYIFSFVPASKEYIDFMMNNLALVIIVESIGIVFATLLLLVDFTVIDHCINDKLPKKYEWLGAYALSFSIIELYLKILNLILRLFQKQEN